MAIRALLPLFLFSLVALLVYLADDRIVKNHFDSDHGGSSAPESVRESEPVRVNRPTAFSVRNPDSSTKTSPTEFRPNGSTDSLLLRFYSLEDHLPVPRVVVYYTDLAPPPGKDNNLTQWVLDQGEIYHADDFAELRLPRGSLTGYVVAMGRGVWGETQVLPQSRGRIDEPAQVMMKAIELVQIKVLDAEGNAAPVVPLVWSAELSGHFSKTLLRMRSDAYGSVVMPVPESKESHRVLSECIYVDGLFPEPIEVTIDRQALPQDPIELRLPECRSLEFAITEPEDLRQANGDLFLAPGWGLYAKSFNREIRLHIVAGKARFDLVGASAAFSLRAQLPFDLGFSPLIEELTTPGARDPVQPIALKFDSALRYPRLSGRLLDPKGNPVSQAQSLSLRYNLAAALQTTRYYGAGVDTDAEGNFSLYLRSRDPISETWSFTFQLDDWEGVPLTWETLVPASTTGQLNLGTIILQETPVFVRGRVVDPEGQGLRRTRVELWLRVEGADQATGLWDYTDSEGHFVLRGNVAPADYFLKALAEDFGQRERDLLPSETEVVIEVPAQGKIRLQVLTENRVSLQGLCYELRAEDGSPRSELLPDDGLLRVLVDPGLYSFRLYDLCDPETTLFAISEIHIEPQKTTNLGTKKLKRSLREVVVTCSGLEALTASERAQVEVLALDIATQKVVGRSLIDPQKDSTTLLVSRPAVDLIIKFADRQSQPLPESAPTTALRLP